MTTLVTSAMVCAWWFVVVRNVSGEITVEAGTSRVDAEEFLIRDYGKRVSFLNDLSEIDLHEPGDYPVRLEYSGRAFEAVLRVRDTQSPAAELRPLEALSITMPQPEDFVISIQDATDVVVEYAQAPDMTIEGEQIVSLLLADESGNTAVVQTSLTLIFDRKPPVIEGVEPMRIYLGNEIDYLSHVTIRDDLDEAPELMVDDSNVVQCGGEYEIIYQGRDASGNETIQTTTLTIVEDNNAPSILGVNPISLYAGGTVSYRSGVLVTDDIDGHPVLRIDSSQVDLSQPGTYEVTYYAKDAAGNETSITTTVTVEEKKAAYVDEETIYAAADKLLATIITDDMTDREKVEAVYRWQKKHLMYTGTSEKTDWLQAAYTMLTKRKGDCFNYYAAAKLMFERLGIPNITVLRSEDSVRAGSHYWSMVSVDGGETYYHYDATPRSADYGGSRNFCLVTDANLDAYDRYFPGYYTRDLRLYPETPEE